MLCALACVSLSNDSDNSNRSKALKKRIEQEAARHLSGQLNGSTNFTICDMVTICERSGVLINVLKKSLQNVFDKCIT